MSEPQLPLSSINSNARTLTFMVVLSFVCALILSLLASALAKPKEIAKDLDRSKQMMIAAKILDHQGHLLIQEQENQYIIAKMLPSGELVPGNATDIATQKQLLEVYQKRLIPFLVDDQGNQITFQQAGIDQEKYLQDYWKTGYYREPLKLFYAIFPPSALLEKSGNKKSSPIGYVIPVNGYGLWDAIYGYLAVKTDGNTVIGISWYDQKETPGLGANIAEASWQGQFEGKRIFQLSPTGKTDFKTAPLGLTVVKGKVADVFGNSPKASSAVDGMAGATLTGNGVTDAYSTVLSAYRPFLIKVM